MIFITLKSVSLIHESIWEPGQKMREREDRWRWLLGGGGPKQPSLEEKVKVKGYYDKQGRKARRCDSYLPI